MLKYIIKNFNTTATITEKQQQRQTLQQHRFMGIMTMFRGANPIIKKQTGLNM